MSNSIFAENLSKSYPQKSSAGPFFAVKNLNIEIHEGEIVAFLGPNGAGKSTTIKMLSGILTPTSGFATILGERAGTKAANKNLGLVFGTRSQLYLHMTVYQSLDLLAEIYYLTGADKVRRIGELSEIFEITSFHKNRVRTLSLGERMRCEVVAALLHRPRVLLADEPTIGLDIVAKNKLRELIRAWQKNERATLLLTSHDLTDVEALCERCILIDHGTKQYDGDLLGVKGDLKELRRISITTRNTGLKVLEVEPYLTVRSSTEPFVHNYEVSARSMPLALQKVSQYYGEDLQDIQISEVTLEEVLGARYRAQDRSQ